MQKTEKAILETLSNRYNRRMPLWFMRQAGRYLPEYGQIRSQKDNFLSFCLSPKLAAQATLQPIERYDLDAAILFADILLIPYALGQKTSFLKGEGPRLAPLDDPSQLVWDIKKLESVFETIDLVKSKLPPATGFIGFAGGLWTVACYMIDGKGGFGFLRSLHFAANEQSFVQRLFEQLHEATLDYLSRQIEAGVEVIQIFDSHAGLLQGQFFEELVIKPTTKLVQALRERFPNVPIIGFPRGACPADYESYVKKTSVSCLGLDQNIPLSFARDTLKKYSVLQGNMDPALLLQGGKAMYNAAEDIYRLLGPNHIFNLGHGVIKETPPEHITELVAFIRGLS